MGEWVVSRGWRLKERESEEKECTTCSDQRTAPNWRRQCVSTSEAPAGERSTCWREKRRTANRKGGHFRATHFGTDDADEAVVQLTGATGRGAVQGKGYPLAATRTPPRSRRSVDSASAAFFSLAVVAKHFHCWLCTRKSGEPAKNGGSGGFARLFGCRFGCRLPNVE